MGGEASRWIADYSIERERGNGVRGSGRRRKAEGGRQKAECRRHEAHERMIAGALVAPAAVEETRPLLTAELDRRAQLLLGFLHVPPATS